MAAAQINVRGTEAIGNASSNGAAGALAIGPFAHPAFVYEVGALGVTAVTVAAETVKVVMDSVERAVFTLPIGFTAGDVVRHVPTAAPTAGVSVSQVNPTVKVSLPRGKLVIPPGETLALDGEGDHTAGTYRIYAKYILQTNEKSVEAAQGTLA